MDIGRFSEYQYARKILSETLKVNNQLIFFRSDALRIGSFDAIHDYLINSFAQNASSAIMLAENNLHAEELFLTNGFKNMFSAKFVSLMKSWLNTKLSVICHSESFKPVHSIKSSEIRLFPEMESTQEYIDSVGVILNEVAQKFGIIMNQLEYYANDKDEWNLYSIISNKEKKAIAIPSEWFESYGSLRFINLFPIIAQTLLAGGTLIADEFDTSIHPMAIMSIINIFHNPDINRNNAQLIFNTHNPIFLNANLFRRDEIKFVERNEENNYSEIYALSDFGTAGKGSVRKNDDYMKNYFINRYGAIHEVDFTPLFESLVETVREG
jgi:AAA15 family ATPase/GTPase